MPLLASPPSVLPSSSLPPLSTILVWESTHSFQHDTTYLLTRLYRCGFGCSKTLVALPVAAEVAAADGQRAMGEGKRKACAKDKQRTSARARHPKEGLITIVVVVSSKPVWGCGWCRLAWDLRW